MAIWTADDGTAINYEVFGQPQPDVLLLLPGLLGSISVQWRNFIRPLSADFFVITMDLRGHGRSDNKAANLMPERMMQDVVGLLDHLKVQTVNISGYSLGGYLGLMLALSQHRRVNSLLMHGTKFYWTAESANKMRDQLDPDQIATKVPSYADQLVQEHGARHWRVLVRWAADMVSYLVNKGLTENMASHAKLPVIISVGDRDELVPLPEAHRLSRVLPNGELLVLPGVKHPFQTIRPMPFLPMMQAFHKNVYKK